ncbi:MAG: DUF2835 domain-containing protein [Gammaproteobacteria bacterium]
MSPLATDIVFSLNISSEQYLRYYRGTARFIVARSADGRTVKFPAGILQQFLTRDGIRGVFILRHDENNRFLAIERRPEKT